MPLSLGLGEHGVAADVAVVLVGDPRLVAEVRARRPAAAASRAAPRRSSGRGSFSAPSACRSSCQSGRANGRWYVGPSCATDRGGTSTTRSPCQSIWSRPVSVTSPIDGRVDVPLLADREERLDVVGLDDRHHPLLRLAHQDLLGRERGVAQRHLVELDVHAAVAGARELGRRAREPGAAEVLDAGDQPGREDLERALDEQLLHERVADLDAGPLRRPARVEGLGREHATRRRCRRRRSWRRTGSPGCRRRTPWPGAGPRGGARRRRAR